MSKFQWKKNLIKATKAGLAGGGVTTAALGSTGALNTVEGQVSAVAATVVSFLVRSLFNWIKNK